MTEKATNRVQKWVGLGKYVAITAVLLHVFVFFATWNNGHDWGGDFSLYIAQAQAILDGNTQELEQINRDCMLRSERRIGPDLYPIGFPLLLVPMVFFFGKSIMAFKLLNLLFFLGTLYLIPKVLNFWGHKSWSYWMVGYLALMPYFMHFEHEIIADLAAWFFTILSLFFFLKAREKQHSWSAFFSGLSIAYALLIKSLSITLLGAMAMTLFIDIVFLKQRVQLRTGVYLLAACILVLLPAKLLYPDGNSSYLEQLVELTPAWLWNNLHYNVALPSSLLMDRDLLYYPFALLFVVGLWTSIRKSAFSLPLWFLLFHLILLTIWPYHEGPRFILIMVPVLILLCFEGLKTIGNLKPTAPIIYSSVFMLVLSGTLAQELYKRKDPAMRPGQAIANDKDAEDLWAYIQENTSPTDTFIFFKPRVLRLFTDRIGYLATKREHAEPLNPDYYIELTQYGGFSDSTFKKVYSNYRFILYEFPRENQ
ncbi:MAG: hypothetical protein EP332_12305 [Bacteroidetes bacterium]|nr:MAG: hypothetical protein EP332_12305 [Bacteroidota bacterium]